MNHDYIIERVDTYPLLYRLEQPYGDANGYKAYRSCFLFKVTTRGGMEGWGECIDWLPTLQKGFEGRVIPYLLGKSVKDRTQLVNTLKKWHRRAAAGVSMALTEIVARGAGLSVTDLWGGKVHDQVPVYASFQSYSADQGWADRSLYRLERALSEGFSMVKVKVGGRSYEEDRAHIEKVRSLLNGGGVGLAIDGNESYDLATTRKWARELDQWEELMWFEEPMPMKLKEDYKILRRSGYSFAVAGGENLLNANQFLQLLGDGAMDIIQPDVQHVDGVDTFRAICGLARDFGVRVSPHTFDGALSRLYALFTQACLPSWSKMEGEGSMIIEPVEWDVMENPFNRLVPIDVKNGKAYIPDGAGIGVEVYRELLDAYRWDGEVYR